MHEQACPSLDGARRIPPDEEGAGLQDVRVDKATRNCFTDLGARVCPSCRVYYEEDEGAFDYDVGPGGECFPCKLDEQTRAERERQERNARRVLAFDGVAAQDGCDGSEEAWGLLTDRQRREAGYEVAPNGTLRRQR